MPAATIATPRQLTAKPEHEITLRQRGTWRKGLLLVESRRMPSNALMLPLMQCRRKACLSSRHRPAKRQTNALYPGVERSHIGCSPVRGRYMLLKEMAASILLTDDRPYEIKRPGRDALSR